jgi:hypothetical protein
MHGKSEAAGQEPEEKKSRENGSYEEPNQNG